MRLIDADALLSERMRSKFYHLPNGDTAVPVIDIEHAPTIGGWISVKDRLPDDASDVLAYYDCGDDSRVMFVNYYKRCWYDSVFNDLIDDLDQGCITHWMPLPEPPKEVKLDD